MIPECQQCLVPASSSLSLVELVGNSPYWEEPKSKIFLCTLCMKKAMIAMIRYLPYEERIKFLDDEFGWKRKE